MKTKIVELGTIDDRMQVDRSYLNRMAYTENCGAVRGDVVMVIRDADDPDIATTHRFRNVITNDGLALFASAMANGISGGRTWHLVLGTGSGTPAATDTGLFTPVAGSAKTGSLSSTGSQYQYYVRYLPEEANGYTYTEAGIYENGGYDTGPFLNHLMLSPTLEKTSDILVDFYITITFS